MYDCDGLVALGVPPVRADALGWTYSTVAAAGSTIADATQVATRLCVVTGADATKGVILPDCAEVGELYLVKNTGSASVLKVYPPSSSISFNGGTAGAAVSIAAYAALLFVMISPTDSIAVELAAA